MELLIIGLDGGDERILRAMETPTITDFFDSNTVHDIEEDLWNRGWVSILSGHHGRNTGAFYEKPVLDGTHQFTQKFGTEGYEENDKITPIWDAINSEGYSIGFMNLPTTVPAPVVNGFFISGAGGGYDPAGGIPDVACYPSEVCDTLRNNDYIWETRFGASGIRDKHKFVDKIKTTVSRRNRLYLELCDSYDPDVGFIVHKELISLQNLVMSEIEEMIDATGPTTEFQEEIASVYELIDDKVDDLLCELDPDHVVVVSDHGSSPYTDSINLDAYLQDLDLQTPETDSTAKSRDVAQKIGRQLPEKVQSIIEQAFPSATQAVMKRSVNWQETEAFGARYVPGIYLNDDRFNGPVSEANRQQLIDMIVENFNKNEIARDHGLSAKPYRERYSDAQFQQLLPDIWVDSPDSMFFTQDGEFIESNEAYGPVESVRDVDRDLYTGFKSSKALLSADESISNLVDKNDPDDLRLAYNLITRFIQK